MEYLYQGRPTESGEAFQLPEKSDATPSRRGRGRLTAVAFGVALGLEALSMATPHLVSAEPPAPKGGTISENTQLRSELAKLEATLVTTEEKAELKSRIAAIRARIAELERGVPLTMSPAEELAATRLRGIELQAQRIAEIETGDVEIDRDRENRVEDARADLTIAKIQEEKRRVEKQAEDERFQGTLLGWVVRGFQKVGKGIVWVNEHPGDALGFLAGLALIGGVVYFGGGIIRCAATWVWNRRPW